MTMLKIYIRHTQYYAIENDPANGLQQGQNIVFAGTNTGNLRPVSGIVPSPNYRDVTEDVGNLNRLQLTWTSERDSSGNLTTNQLNPKRAASNSIEFEGASYLFIKKWLVDHVAAPLNAVDVRIEHIGCGTYEDFQIKSSQVRWCEDDQVCAFELTIQQKDPYYTCIQKTLIEDNHQGWFQRKPSGGKKHPRFVYCNEIRPNMMMIMLWYISTVIFTLMYILALIINPIVRAVNIIIGIINAFKWLFGADPIKYVDPFRPGEYARSFYLESSGCGRMYPAPLIRDYIYNVCKKCGVEVDEVSAPIFFSKMMAIDTSSDRVVRNRQNPYYNATYLAPTGVRGLRVFDHLFGSARDTTTFWMPENAPGLSLDMFLDQLKGVFNAEWRIANVNGRQTLYFWRKDWFTNGKYLYDFTKPNDRVKILQGVCFSWNDMKMPTFMRGIYNTDSMDSCGNEAKKYMNDTVPIGNKTNAPQFDGVMDKTSQFFGATKFRLDGASRDYIADALQVTMNGAILNPTIPAILKEVATKVLTQYADYALLLSDECTALGKILIWDASSGHEYAKVIRTKKVASTTISDLPLPEPNPVYNPANESWTWHNPPHTKVTGSNLSPGPEPVGQYQVKMTPLSSKLYDRPALLCNYPMFFRSYYRDNLFDWFHWIDDPNHNPKMNMTWEVKIDLCCPDLKKLGLFGDGSQVKLLSKVKVPNQYYQDGVITEIIANYDDTDSYGKHITIKGTL